MAKRTMEETVEWLAIAVQQGFIDMKEEFREGLGKVEDRLDVVQKELSKVKFRSSDLNPRVTALEEKVEIISTRLDLQS